MKPLELGDFLFIAPYNAQVRALQEALPPDAYEIPIAGDGAPDKVTIFMYRDDGKPKIGLPNDSYISFPTGQQFPEQIPINMGDEEAYAEAVKKKQQELFAHPRFRGRAAVPLRRGVFEFLPENADPNEYPGADSRPNYMRIEGNAA